MRRQSRQAEGKSLGQGAPIAKYLFTEDSAQLHSLRKAGPGWRMGPAEISLSKPAVGVCGSSVVTLGYWSTRWLHWDIGVHAGLCGRQMRLVTRINMLCSVALRSRRIVYQLPRQLSGRLSGQAGGVD